jgi:hypothetical protein
MSGSHINMEYPYPIRALNQWIFPTRHLCVLRKAPLSFLSSVQWTAKCKLYFLSRILLNANSISSMTLLDSLHLYVQHPSSAPSRGSVIYPTSKVTFLILLLIPTNSLIQWWPGGFGCLLTDIILFCVASIIVLVSLETLANATILMGKYWSSVLCATHLVYSMRRLFCFNTSKRKSEALE